MRFGSPPRGSTKGAASARTMKFLTYTPFKVDSSSLSAILRSVLHCREVETVSFQTLGIQHTVSSLRLTDNAATNTWPELTYGELVQHWSLSR
jgi:hypothetical protein